MTIPKNRGALPYGYMSLAEMINCNVYGLASLTSGLMNEVIRINLHIQESGEHNLQVADQDMDRIWSMADLCRTVCKEFEWDQVMLRIERLEARLNSGLTYTDLYAEVRVIKEMVEDNLKGQFIYRYSNERSAKIRSWQIDWATVLKAFPSAEKDIKSAIDLWALSHPTASVFHVMRIIEIGIGCLAKDVGRTFDVQNWQNIINEIDSEIKKLGKTLQKGKSKNERLQFLSEATSELTFLKDGWRNYVSHNKVKYFDEDAYSALEHGHRFMKKLAENGLKEIP